MNYSSFFDFSNIEPINYESFETFYITPEQLDPEFSSKDANFINTKASPEDLIKIRSKPKKICQNPFESSFQSDSSNENIEACDKNIQNFIESVSSCSKKIKKVHSRSKKICQNPFESSFQSNFLYEHIEACNKNIQNFIESVSSCSKKIQKQKLRIKLIQSSSFSCEQILDSENCCLEENQKRKFKADLRVEKKLKEFLDQICKKFTSLVSGQLMKIANFVWINYIKVMDGNFSQTDIFKWANKLAQTKFKCYIKYLNKTKEICFKENQNEALPNFGEATKEFMKYFFTTVVLTVEQYFENPYFKKDKIQIGSLKRVSSSEDYYSLDQQPKLQENKSGVKKMKK